MTTTDVSRLILAHPDLGTAGGAGLHAAITAIYKKIGDNLSSRIMVNLSVVAAATATFEHDFKAAFGELRYDLYIASNSDPYDLTRITASSSPSLSQFAVSATSGFATTKIDVVNNSGATRNLVLVVHMDPLKFGEGDVQDVDVTTTAPQDGQALVYNSTSGKWVPGASGDSSYKLQSVTTPNASLKGGYIETSDGKELATYSGSGTVLASYGVDLTLNLTTIFGSAPANATNYYLYIDLSTIGTVQTISDTGRKVYRITQANFVISTSGPETFNPNRYLPVGNILSATTGTAWSGSGSAFTTFSTKKHYAGPRFDQTSTAQDGQTWTYDLANDKYVPGASGDSSFKLQTISSNNLLLKGGHIMLADGRELATFDGGSTYGGDITVSLTTLLASPVNGTTYYLYIDLNALAAGVLDESVNRKIYGVTVSQLALFTTLPEAINLARYVPIGLVVGIAGSNYSTTAFKSLATRFGDNKPVAISPLTSRPFTGSTINKPGTSGQFAAGHILTTKSWPSALTQASQLAYWNLAANSNDNGPQGINLTNNNTIPFTASNIFATASAAAALTAASSQYFSSSSQFLNPSNGGAKSFAFGSWVKLTNYATGGATSSYCVMQQASATGDRSFLLSFGAGTVNFLATNTAASWDTQITASTSHLTNATWHHVAASYNTTTGVMKLYLDGALVAQGTQATIRPATTPTFYYGRDYSGDYIDGSIEDGFFVSNFAMTDADIRRVYSYRYDHGSNTAVGNQRWNAKVYPNGGEPATQAMGWLVSAGDVNSVFWDLGDLGASDTADVYMEDLGLNVVVATPVPPYDTTFSADPTGTIAHGQSETPEVRVFQETGTAGQFVELTPLGIVAADGTNLIVTASHLTVGASPNRLRIVARPMRLASVGVPDANTTRTGSVTSGRQNLGGVKVAVNGISSASNIRGSEGAGTTTLTDNDNREQTFSLTAARTCVLPSAGIIAGECFILENTGAFDLTVQASGGQNLTAALTNLDATIQKGRVILRALVATPTTAANWLVEYVFEQYVSPSLTWTTSNSANTTSTAPLISRLNDKVDLRLPITTVTTTTSDTNINTSVALPVRFRPAASQFCTGIRILNGGTVQTTPGLFRVNTDGTMGIHVNSNTSAAFAAGVSGPDVSFTFPYKVT